MNFKYTMYDVEPTATIPDGVIYRPQVFLRIAGANSELYLLALVDTGADETIVPISVAEEIGVELDDSGTSQASGVTGQVIELVPGHAKLAILDGTDTYQWDGTISFARFANDEDECTILGHVGALEYFTATFDGERNEGKLIPNGKLPQQ